MKIVCLAIWAAQKLCQLVNLDQQQLPETLVQYENFLNQDRCLAKVENQIAVIKS
jgi:hypothetical protein